MKYKVGMCYCLSRCERLHDLNVLFRSRLLLTSDLNFHRLTKTSLDGCTAEEAPFSRDF